MVDKPPNNIPEQKLPARTVASPSSALSSALSGLGGVKVRVTAVLGSTEITFDRAVELDPETLLVVDRNKDDPVDLCVNGKVVARGKLVVADGELGVTLTEIVDSRAVA